MWDLTITGDHDFYIQAATTAILVHNCGDAPEDNTDLSSWLPDPPQRTYQTYIKKNPGTGQVYAGKTSGYGTPLENVAHRDYGHAYNRLGFGPAQLDRSSVNEDAIKGREQMLIGMGSF